MFTRPARLVLGTAVGIAAIGIPTAAWASTTDDATATADTTIDQDVQTMRGDRDGDGTRDGGRAGHGGRGMMNGDGDRDGECDRDGDGPRDGGRAGHGGRGMMAPGLTVEGEASTADAASLAAMAEEERMARDLYLEFAETWDERPFDMLAHAEDRHLGAVERMLEAYGLEIPGADAERGEFADAAVQRLYDDLLAQGSESVTAALEVVALVEETDIADLRAQDVDSDAIADLYAHLEHGSERHLTAAVRELDDAGVDYEASVLDADEIAEITGVPAP